MTAKIVKQRSGRAEESLPFEPTVLLLQGGGALGSWIAARWELAMLRTIQANHLALNLNVRAVCAVFVFVGAVYAIGNSGERALFRAVVPNRVMLSR
ncbi:MAG: hypothetical protein WBL43_05005 [Pseudolabrys sp.]